MLSVSPINDRPTVPEIVYVPDGISVLIYLSHPSVQRFKKSFGSVLPKATFLMEEMEQLWGKSVSESLCKQFSRHSLGMLVYAALVSCF